MRLFSLGLVLALVGCADTSGTPRLPAEPRVEAPQRNPEADAIVVHVDASGLRVSYRLRAPSQAFVLGESAADIRKDTWKLEGPGLSFTEQGIAATSALSSFEISVGPDSHGRDRVYPALTRVGEGWLLYAPHLRVQGMALPDGLSIERPAGWTILGRKDARGKLVADGYVFLGPAGFVHHGSADIVSAPSTPTWLVREIEKSAVETTAFYERRLGLPLRDHPTIAVTYEPEKRGSFHGDTTPGAMMSLRLYGSAWSEDGSAALETLADFVHHELFHFWNAELARASDAASRPWLHEGGANYAALLASTERRTMTEEAFDAHLNRHLERCQRALGDRDLRDNGPTRGGDTYACGTVLQWAADIGLRATSNGQRDALSWWKDILVSSARNGGIYSLESAYALIGSDASRAVDALLSASDDRKWAKLADAAAHYGAPMVLTRLANRDLGGALSHVLAIHCGKSYGFFTSPDRVKLDSGTHCGPLSGDLEVDSIAGFNPVTASSAMYDEVRRLCSAKKSIAFGWKGEIVARAPCTAPLAAPSLGWQVRREGK